MPLGTRVKVKVLDNSGTHIKTIQRCLRPFTNKYSVLYECHRYLIQGNPFSDDRYIQLK